MKVRVAFTVEFDPEEYRMCFGDGDDPLTDIRRQVKIMAMNEIAFTLSDAGVNNRIVEV